ncbi:hypothetical protein [Klebsiella michiganensis]|uniref:hypothetical protein n=1 Tax=Klebsiella michiganensis TaxID=1134687 RepID=UPI0034A0D12E
MTNNQLTRERLEKIKSWRETYGAGSNVMLPAEEAEELARMALAAMESEPVRNPVLSYADSYRDMAKQGIESVPIWSVITDLERNIAPLYRHAQPAPVVPEEMTIRDACKFVQDMRLFDDVSVIVMRTWNACRAAMLNHPSSIQPNTGAAPGAEIKHPSSNSQVIGIDPASGPDRTVEVRYVAPPGYVMVPKEPTSEMVKKMRYHVGGYDRNIKEGYKAMLAAAPQEVNHG